MKTELVRLTFLTPVHFGGGRLSDSEYTCDAATLFSALFISALPMQKAEELLKAANTGEVAISDAFPFIGDTYYLPKPASSANTHTADIESGAAESTDSRAKKAFKKLKYLPVEKISSFMSGTLDPIPLVEGFRLGSSAAQTKVNLQAVPENDAMPYAVGGFTFAPDAGLYFVKKGSYPIEPLLEALSFSGLGGKRNVGYGRFAYEIVNAPAFTALLSSGSSGRTGRKMLLSTAAPAAQEWDEHILENAKYTIVRKGGFAQSGSRAAATSKKRDMFLFRPGSLFARPFEGDIFDVNTSPGTHPVYRYARALWAEV